MRDIRESRRFRRDLRRMRQQGKDLSKLYDVVETLARGEDLDARHRPHPLTGDWRPFWDCHIEPDWLLIYRVQDGFVELYRTGNHDDLFE
jgi:mRNA interferase YafQ